MDKTNKVHLGKVIGLIAGAVILLAGAGFGGGYWLGKSKTTTSEQQPNKQPAQDEQAAPSRGALDHGLGSLPGAANAGSGSRFWSVKHIMVSST